MAEVALSIGGADYRVGCRDGGEAHLQEVARLLDGKIADVVRSVGATGEVRRLLLGALLLADELLELRGAPARAPADDELAGALEMLASRIEAIAAGLEAGGATS